MEAMSLFAAGTSYTLRILERDGTTSTVRCRSSQTLLGALAAAGRKLIVVGCENGGCGVCKVQIVEGTWAVSRPMSCAHVSEEEQQRGKVLACRVKATSDITLRILGKETSQACPD